MQGPTSRPFSPLSPAPSEAPAQEATALPGSIPSPTAADTPLTRRLRGWDPAGTTTSAGQVPRESPMGQAESPIRGLEDMEVVAWSPIDPDVLATRAAAEAAAGSRRVSVADEAEVRDPRILHLADDAALSDDEDADVRLPPPPQNGASPDTSFAPGDPALDALWTAMTFNGAAEGLDSHDSARLLRDPHARAGLLAAMDSALAARGTSRAGRVPDRVMAEVAHEVTRNFLRHTRLAEAPPSPPPPDEEAPSFDELQARLDALIASHPVDSPGDSPRTAGGGMPGRPADSKG